MRCYRMFLVFLFFCTLIEIGKAVPYLRTSVGTARIGPPGLPPPLNPAPLLPETLPINIAPFNQLLSNYEAALPVKPAAPTNIPTDPFIKGAFLGSATTVPVLFGPPTKNAALIPMLPPNYGIDVLPENVPAHYVQVEPLVEFLDGRNSQFVGSAPIRSWQPFVNRSPASLTPPNYRSKLPVVTKPVLAINAPESPLFESAVGPSPPLVPAPRVTRTVIRPVIPVVDTLSPPPPVAFRSLVKPNLPIVPPVVARIPLMLPEIAFPAPPISKNVGPVKTPVPSLPNPLSHAPAPFGSPTAFKSLFRPSLPVVPPVVARIPSVFPEIAFPTPPISKIVGPVKTPVPLLPHPLSHAPALFGSPMVFGPFASPIKTMAPLAVVPAGLVIHEGHSAAAPVPPFVYHANPYRFGVYGYGNRGPIAW